MKAPTFELNKIRRLIRVAGLPYTFQRDVINEFKEPTGETTSIEVKGIFHEITQHIAIVAEDSASVRDKNTSYILALYSDAKDIQQRDFVVISGRKYYVNGVRDINNWHIAVDISLEEVV